MTLTLGRDSEKRLFWTLLNRYTGGVFGYFGMSGIGKSTLLSTLEQEIRQTAFTPYIARLDFSDPAVNHPVAAFINLIDQLEATGQTTTVERTGFLGLGKKRSESPLTPARQALALQVQVNQTIDIRARQSSVSDVVNNATILVGEVGPAQLAEAVGKFKLGLSKLPVTPVTPPNYSSLKRPLVVLLADTLEQATPAVLDWLKQLGSPMLEEYLLLVAAGQEKIEKLLTRELSRIDDAAARKLLNERFRLFDPAIVDPVVKLARGIPRCLCLAGEFLQSQPDQHPASWVTDAVEDHLVGDYLVRGILKRLPDSSTEKHLLTYGCVLRRWENAEQLRAVLFAVPTVRDMLTEGADIRGAMSRLRERSFLDSGQPHPTLRDLLLHDLEQEEPGLLKALQRSAADWYLGQRQVADAVPHLLALKDWAGILTAWQTALAGEETVTVAALVSALAGLRVPAELDDDWLRLTVESGLLLRNGALLLPIIHLLQRTTEEQKAAVEMLARRVADITSDSTELHWQLREHQAADDAERASALLGLGAVRLFQDRYEQAAEAFAEARDLWQAINDRLGLANALRGLGEVRLLQNRYEQAAEAFAEARDLWQAINDRLGLASALMGLGEVRRFQNRYEQAAEAFAEARDLFQAINDRRGLASALRGLGEVRRFQNRYEQAEADFAEARDLCQAINDRRGLANALRGLGDVRLFQDRYEQAEADFAEARDLCQAINDRYGLAYALSGLGNVRRFLNRYEQAEADFAEARDVFQAINDRRGLANALIGLGDVRRLQNRYEQAEADFAEARDLCQAINDRYGLAYALSGLGEVRRFQNRYEQAEAAYAEARDLFQAINDRYGLANALIGLCQVGLGQQARRKGLDHLAALEVLLQVEASKEFHHAFPQAALMSLRASLEALPP